MKNCEIIEELAYKLAEEGKIKSKMVKCGNAEIITPAETINTLPAWNRLGKKIKKGQKALGMTKIWKPCKVTGKDETTGKETTVKKLLLVDAYFFSESQVEDKPAEEPKKKKGKKSA